MLPVHESFIFNDFSFYTKLDTRLLLFLISDFESPISVRLYKTLKCENVLSEKILCEHTQTTGFQF